MGPPSGHPPPHLSSEARLWWWWWWGVVRDSRPGAVPPPPAPPTEGRCVSPQGCGGPGGPAGRVFPSLSRPGWGGGGRHTQRGPAGQHRPGPRTALVTRGGPPPPPPSPPRRSGRWAPVWRRDEPCGLRAGFPGLGLRGCVMPEGKSLRAGWSGISAGKATGAVRLPNRPHAAAWLLFIFFFLIFIFFPFSTERPQFPQQDLPV